MSSDAPITSDAGPAGGEKTASSPPKVRAHVVLFAMIVSILAFALILFTARPTCACKSSSQAANVHAIQNAIEIFADDTGLYPEHLSDLTRTDPTKTRGVQPNLSGQGGVVGGALTLQSNYHGPYLKAIPINTVTKGLAEGTDYLYNNQQGTIVPVQQSY